MASDHSFDVVSRVNIQETLNAVNQAMMEIKQRFDFKGVLSEIELKESENQIILLAADDLKLKSIITVLQGKLVKRGVSLKSLVYGKVEGAAGGNVRQEITLQQGISSEKAKEMVKLIKNLKFKVQAQIREKEVRVSGKKRDELQKVIAILKEKDLGLPLQFENYR